MVNIAIAGIGAWGKNVVRNFRQIKEANIIYCYDSDTSSLRWVKKSFPDVKVVDEYDQVLQNREIDAVVISTPPHTHFVLARKALDYGKDVMIEKPLTLRSEDAEVLLELAGKKERILMVGHLLKYHPAVRKMREKIKVGEVGKVYYLHSQRLNPGKVRGVENVIWCLGTHDVYLAVYLLNRYPQEVNAFGRSFLQTEREIEDVAFLTLFFDEQIFSHIHLSWFHPEKVRETKVVGEKKVMEFNEVDSPYRIKMHGRDIDTRQRRGEVHFEVREGNDDILEVEEKQPLREECLHFIECIQEERRPRTDGEEGLKIVKILEAAQRSMKERKPVKISY